MRKVFYDLSGRVAHTHTTLLFLGEYSSGEIEGTPEFSLADGILQLTNCRTSRSNGARCGS